MSAMDGVITKIKKVLDDMKYNDNDNNYKYKFGINTLVCGIALKKRVKEYGCPEAQRTYKKKVLFLKQGV